MASGAGNHVAGLRCARRPTFSINCMKCGWSRRAGPNRENRLFQAHGTVTTPLIPVPKMEPPGLAEVVPDIITTHFEFADFDDYWTSFLSGDRPPGQMVMGLAPDQHAKLEQEVRHVFLSGRRDGPRSFIGAAWICKGVVPAA